MASHYLGAERFGLWMTISSFTALLAFADLGVGNGLLNAVAQATGRDDLIAVRRAISNAVVALFSIAIFAAIVLLTTVWMLDWTHIFGLHSLEAIQEARLSLAAFVMCFVVNIPLGIVNRVQFGLQMGFVSGLWQSFGSIVGLVSVFLATTHNLGLPILIVALLGGPALAATANTAIFFTQTRPELRPRISDLSRSTIRSILQLGGLFFALQVAGALAFSTDPLISARFYGAESVGDYAVAAKLFSSVSILTSLLLHPLWPAYAEALARNDRRWVRRTFWTATIGVTSIAGVFSFALLIIFDRVIQVWVHRAIHVSMPLLAGFAVWSVIEAAGVSVAMFLNGAHVVKLQVMLAGMFSISCICLKLLLIDSFGLTVLPWTTVITYLALSLIPALSCMKRWLPSVSPACSTVK